MPDDGHPPGETPPGHLPGDEENYPPPTQEPTPGTGDGSYNPPRIKFIINSGI
jgi:hypothetical protein